MALKITKQLDKCHRLFFKLHTKPGPLVRACYCTNKEAGDLEKLKLNELSSNFSKFKVFRDEDSTVILDIEQERQQIKKDHHNSQKSIYENLNLERGSTGVFEIWELVDILKKDNCKDLFVCEVPQSIKYVDYMCIVTGNSYRHMLGMANYVRRIYKMKRHPTDVIPKIEGENCKNWMALDLGNIALHIFSQSAREKYDLESLWTLGAEFDPQSNKRNALFELYEQHSTYLTSPQMSREFKDAVE